MDDKFKEEKDKLVVDSYLFHYIDKKGEEDFGLNSDWTSTFFN